MDFRQRLVLARVNVSLSVNYRWSLLRSAWKGAAKSVYRGGH
jgi:hypothetical protein